MAVVTIYRICQLIDWCYRKKEQKNERAFLLLPVGYPKQPVYVPHLERKQLDEEMNYYV